MITNTKYKLFLPLLKLQSKFDYLQLWYYFQHPTLQDAFLLMQMMFVPFLLPVIDLKLKKLMVLTLLSLFFEVNQVLLQLPCGYIPRNPYDRQC